MPSVSERVLRVVLVDDHEVVRQGLRALLQAQEDVLVVAEAESARQAVAAVDRHRPDVVVMANPAGGSMALMSANKATPETLVRLAPEGFGQPIIEVEVRNVGRLAVTVSRWSLESNIGGVSCVPIADSIGSTLPHRLDAGESQTWVTDLRNAVTLAQTTTEVLGHARETAWIVGVVELGDGRTYTTPESFT